MFDCFLQLFLNNTQAAVDGISTLILEGDRFFFFFYCLEKFQEEDVVIGKKSDHMALCKQKVKAAQSSHITPHVDLLDLLGLDWW